VKKSQIIVSYAAALYCLGYGQAKINQARELLVKIEGVIQHPAQELLTKVNSARGKAK
jgi:hypothetical protein